MWKRQRIYVVLQTAVSSLSSQLRGGLPAAEARQAEAADMAEAVQLAAGVASASPGPLPGQHEASVSVPCSSNVLSNQYALLVDIDE